MDLGTQNPGSMKIVYKQGRFIEGAEESFTEQTLDEPKSFHVGSSYIQLDNDKYLAEEGLALVGRKVLESRKEGLKLNESAAVINNVVKRIRRTIEAKSEALKKQIDSSAEEAYLCLNNILNDFCEEGRSFRASLESFNLVMKRCRVFIERFKEGQLENPDQVNSPPYTEHLMQILSTLSKTRTPTFDFNLQLSYQPNNKTLDSKPVGTLILDNPDKPIYEENKGDGVSTFKKEKECYVVPVEEEVLSTAQISRSFNQSSRVTFDCIQELKFWRSVECVNTKMRPLGLVSVLMMASDQKSSQQVGPIESNMSIKNSMISHQTCSNPVTEEVSPGTPLRSQFCAMSGGEGAVKNPRVNHNYLLLSSSSEMEIFDSEMSKLLRCVKVHSIKQPLDLVAWNEWVAISNNKSDLLHIVSMISQTVSKFSIPGGCGNLSVDETGRITISCRHTNNIVMFDAQLNKLTTTHLPSSITKATHAIHINNFEGFKNCMLVCHVDVLHRICLLDSYGNILHSFGDSRGSERYQLDSPEYMLVDAKGNVIVCDSGNCRLMVLDPHLHLIKEISLKAMKVVRPTKITIDYKTQSLFVTDADNMSIIVAKIE